MKNANNQSKSTQNVKVAPVSCHCKLSLLVVHLQYLNESRKSRTPNNYLPKGTEAQALFYQYV